MTSFTAHLDTESLKRYNNKLELLGISDPYTVPQVLFYPLHASSKGKLPDLQNMDIINYLLFAPSPYTGQTLKAYKSTDAYKYFQAGWVQDVKVWHLDTKNCFVFLAKVRIITVF